MGSISSIPEGYSYSTMLALGRGGITAAVKQWGTALLRLYGKVP